MKHDEPTSHSVSRETSPIEPDRLATWLGVGLDTRQAALLARYEQWLVDEAIPAGGLGPDEAPRIRDRHVLDALAYVRGIPVEATWVVDIGTGVGLPGIPIAIVRPDLRVTLLDRSGRRIGLLRRVIRVLDLANAEVVQGDVNDVGGAWDVAVFRASLPIGDAAGVLRRITTPGGVGLVGVSRLAARPVLPDAPSGLDFELTDEGGSELDSPFWLLTMRPAH